MSDGAGIDWDALFPGANKQSDKGDAPPSYAPLLAVYRIVRQQLDRDGATPEEATILTRMLVEPLVMDALFRGLRGTA